MKIAESCNESLYMIRMNPMQVSWCVEGILAVDDEDILIGYQDTIILLVLRFGQGRIRHITI
jgi:hypothetical protein